MAYGDFEDLTQRTCLDKVLCHKTFDIDENPEMMNIKEILFQWFIIFFYKKRRWFYCYQQKYIKSAVGRRILQASFFFFFFEKKLKVYSSFNGNISGKDLTDI